MYEDSIKSLDLSNPLLKFRGSGVLLEIVNNGNIKIPGSVLYHPVLYRTKESIEIDQKLHLYSYLNNAKTMKEVENGMVFQNLTEQAELLYVEVR